MKVLPTIYDRLKLALVSSGNVHCISTINTATEQKIILLPREAQQYKIYANIAYENSHRYIQPLLRK